jgi:hypothetical protein
METGNLIMTLLYLLIALQLKHFIIDFPLQTKYQWSNKGTYGHLGGILHAFLHGLGTTGVLCYFTGSLEMAVLLGFLDMVIHYHIDWAKMRLNAKMSWGPTTHPEFWVLLGLDQLLHQLTYIGIVFALMFD